MKKVLTVEQTAARDARRAQFKAICKTVAAMSDDQKAELSRKYGFRKLDGGEFSMVNSMLLAMQCPGGTILGGFRSWMKAGRCVRKGEHGSMVWVPIGRKSKDAVTEVATTDAGGERPGFITGTVFDIAQTDEIGKAVEATAAVVMGALALESEAA